MIYNQLSFLHPKFERVAIRLANTISDAHKAGRLKLSYEPFETYRLPERQEQLLHLGTTKAGMWQSDHQFGLAVDFVGINENGGLTWAIPNADLVYLGIIRKQFENELAPAISWDFLHFASPLGAKIRQILK